MKKVSVITLQNIKNYGSMLQAYATQELLRDKGFEAEIVDYTRPIAKFWNHILGYSTKDNILVRMVKTVILFPTELRYALLWKSFKKIHLNSSAISYTTNEELKANPPQADIYCSGSDQVWNSGWNGGLLREFFLDYVPVGKPKYALASSVGMNEFNDAEKQELRSLLQEFSSISVRETSAVDMIKGLGIDNVYAVMDPTLTKDAAFWSKLATAPKHKKPYILIYQLGKDHRVDEYAKFMAEKTGMEVVRICIRYDYALRYGKSILIPSFEEFLTLFANASYVITDSFHATCFSINFNRKFWCILPDMYQGRIVDLLTMVDEKQRIVPVDYNNLDVTAEVNYDHVNKVIAEQRKKTLVFYDKLS